MSIFTAAVMGLLLLSPPSGRPPTGALQRYEPRMYDVNLDVQLNTAAWPEPRLPDDVVPGAPLPQVPQVRADDPVVRLVDTPIVMPLILQGAFSRLDHTSLDADLWLNGRVYQNLDENSRLDDGFPHHLHMAVMVIDQFEGRILRWSMRCRAQSFSSRIDDQLAAQVPWPRQWPDEVADGLRPQKYIESDDPIFAETLQRISGGNLRLVPPYLAAKDIIRFCVNEVQVSGSGTLRAQLGIIRGMNVDGAVHTARAGRGTPHDLVCVCVAMLKAAGIPARPVIGIEEDERDRTDFVSWGEFYLPDTGWVPFDPVEMGGKGVRHRDVRAAWPEFGTMDDLNRRIPLSYFFIAPAFVESPMRPAVWGWDPRPAGAPYMNQAIMLEITSRGRGVEDPG